jgi:hypothetical protein
MKKMKSTFERYLGLSPAEKELLPKKYAQISSNFRENLK